MPKEQNGIRRTHRLNVLTLLLMLLFVHGAFSVKHHLRYFLSATSGTLDLPEFIVFGTLDDTQWGYCDSSGRVEAQQEWARRFCQDNPQYLQMYTGSCDKYKHRFSGYIKILNQQMNQTEGVHTFQAIQGCDWDDETEDVDGIIKFGYDGENFISFDFNTSTWVAAKSLALITKHNWDRDLHYSEELQNSYIYRCPQRLKKYLEYLKKSKKKTAAPSVSLLHGTPSSPVSCHATGFYPANAVMFWRRDGQQVHEDVQYWEVLPNHDHTFQMSVELNISLIKAEDWRRYECVFHLPGVKEELVTRLDRDDIKSNWVPPPEFPVVTVVAVVVTVPLLLGLCISGLYLWKRKYSGFRPANSPQPSPEETCCSS